MVDRRLVDEDDVSRIGLRIKAARVLTSFNQEEFAEKFGFGHASVKNWELGRSIPRKETFAKIISSFGDSGVQVTRDWLLYGSGSGPTHGDLSTGETVSNASLGIDKEIAEFERWCKQNKHKSLMAIADDMMAPFYFEGDCIGAVELDFNEYQRRSAAISKQIEAPLLVEIEAGNYQPRFLRYDKSGDLKWLQSQQGNFVADLEFKSLGKIMWVRRAF
jgi:transcriptional regulator with XRE-family HTH domain